MLLNCGVREDSCKSLGLQGDPTSLSKRKSVLNIHWKDWCWNSNTLATWSEELSHWKRPWCWERLKAGGEGDDRGWDGWIASLTQFTWVWVNSRSWWGTGKPGILQSLGLKRVGHDWMPEMILTEEFPMVVVRNDHPFNGLIQQSLLSCSFGAQMSKICLSGLKSSSWPGPVTFSNF